MDIVSFGSLIQNAKYYSDMEVSGNVTDPEWQTYVNFAAKRYYDIVNMLMEDYNLSVKYYQIQNNVDLYALPDDFLHCRGVDLSLNPAPVPEDPSTIWYALEAYNFKERNKMNYFWSRQVSSGLYSKYRIQGENLSFEPIFVGSTTCRLYYVPVLPKMVALTDTMNVIHGFDEYIARMAAEMALEKQETVNELLSARILKLESSIRQIALDRNRDEGKTIANIYIKRSRLWF